MEALTAVAVAGLTVYDMAKAIDKGMVITEITLVEKTKRSRLKAAVLTVSDRVSRGEADDVSGDTLEELLLADGFEVIRRLVADERDEIARAIVDLAEDSDARAHDRRHGSRRARRDARGDALGARARGAGDRRGDPRRLDREDAARAALARASRARSARTLVVNLAGSPGACRDGYAVLRPALTHALQAARRPAHGHRPRPHLTADRDAAPGSLRA